MATPIPRNRASFTLDAVARATGGSARGRDDLQLRGVAIDSRHVEPGNLFVAIRGVRHDGHRFVDDAVESGAAAVLVRRGASVPPHAAAVEVEDTERALGDLAAAHRRRWGGPVVAITGSAGKTTTKELTAVAVEATGVSVHRTPGNLNNLVGMPMTLLALDEQGEVAVLELGTNRPGEIARLAEIAGPDVGVVTLVAPAHTEGLGTVERVAEEKTALLRALGPGGVAVVNADDEPLMRWAQQSAPPKRLSFGGAEQCDVRLVSWRVDSALRTHCVFSVRAHPRPVEARLRLLGQAAAANAAAALAVVLARGGDIEAAATALEGVVPTPGRMRPVRGERGCLILDDSYNANPRSLALALDTAAQIAGDTGGRLIAVLGDMKELGARTGAEHEAAGRHAAAAGAVAVVCCGTAMADAAAEAERAGIRAGRAADSDEAAELTARLLQSGDVVLVKGSRSMAMERVVDRLAQSGEVEA